MNKSDFDKTLKNYHNVLGSKPNVQLQVNKTPNRICKLLNIQYPIIQAPMSYLTDAKFVSAVSKAGGMGCIGPYAGEAKQFKMPHEGIDAVREEVKKAKSETSNPISLNIIVSDKVKHSWADQLFELAISEKIPAICYITGIQVEQENVQKMEQLVLQEREKFLKQLAEYKGTLKEGQLPEKQYYTDFNQPHPDILEYFPLFSKFKENGIKIVYRNINPTKLTAAMAELAGADIIVATGIDEGGHAPAKPVGTFTIVPTIVDAVIQTPVMAAGGITDPRHAKAAFCLGAEGLYIGTGFINTNECRVADGVKHTMHKFCGYDLIIWHHGISSHKALPVGAGTQINDMIKNNDFSLVSTSESYKNSFLNNDLENGYCNVGQGISTMTKIYSVKEFIELMVRDLKL